MNTKTARRGRGFTLVELLVVIAIIGVLAAILVPTLYRVVVKARQNVIAQEVNQLHLAIESYKQKFGDYPPDFTSLRLVNDLATQNQLVVRHLRKSFPRHQENLIDAFTDGNNILEKPTPAEALVFWLSQVYEDSRQPLSSAGQTTTVKLFPFDEKRLVYTRTIGNPNRPNSQHKLYVYVPPQGKDAPYVYFDSRIYTDPSPIPGVTPATPVASLSVYFDPSGQVLYPYASKVNASSALSMANKTTYQLISAGLDGEYGDSTGVTAGNASTYKVFPFGINYRIGDMDNIANFSDGKIFEDHLE